MHTDRTPTLLQRAVHIGAFFVPVLTIVLFGFMVILATRPTVGFGNVPRPQASTIHVFPELAALAQPGPPSFDELKSAVARINPGQMASVRIVRPPNFAPGDKLWLLADDPSTNTNNQLILVSSDEEVTLAALNGDYIVVPAKAVARPVTARRLADGTWKWEMGGA